MTPKQQAVRLFDEIDEITEYLLPTHTVKKLAIHEVNDILKLGWNLPHYDNLSGKDYWQKVKKEIENL